MTGVLGLFVEGLPSERKVDVSEEVMTWLKDRDAARAAKDWAEADRLRDLITGAGFEILDGAGGSQVRQK